MRLQGSEVSETYVNTNLINRVSSSSTSNTQEVVIEGHTASGSGTDLQLTFVTQTVTLNGQTPVELTTPLARATRIYNNSSTNLATNSAVYVYQSTSAVSAGVPSDATKVHVVMDQANNDNTSNKCATAFSNVDYGLITQAYLGIDQKTAANADFRLKIRLPGKLFRTQWEIPLQSAANASTWFDFRPFIIVPKNSDVIITAKTSTNNVSVSAGFNALICKVQN